MKLVEAIETLYRVARPQGDFRTPRGWFLLELQKRGAEISRTTLHHWCHGKLPDDRKPVVRETITSIASDALASTLGDAESIRVLLSSLNMGEL